MIKNILGCISALFLLLDFDKGPDSDKFDVRVEEEKEEEANSNSKPVVVVNKEKKTKKIIWRLRQIFVFGFWKVFWRQGWEKGFILGGLEEVLLY